MRNASEQAQLQIDIFLSMIKESWTWVRLTKTEKDIFITEIKKAKVFNLIKKFPKTAQEILNALYDMFLMALGYTDWNWRE